MQFLYIYAMLIRPKYKRFIKQLLPFPIMWFIFAFIYCFVEYGVIGSLDAYPSTGNPYNFKTNIVFTCIACIIVGIVQGVIEIFWLRKRFEKNRLWIKIFFKTLFYSSFIIVSLIGLTIFNSLLFSANGDWTRALLDLERFIGSFAFWSVIIYISVVLSFALFFTEIAEYLGNGVLYNFMFGKYHQPKQETRIFMFLDMKSSTSIAETLGHESYFNLLKTYYADMTAAILATSGEIYQYVGDEIVVSWEENKGIYRNNCVQCFLKISETFVQRKAYYLEKHKVFPEFKAGFHIGAVTTGEIGIIKKDIIYTGDVLNTTARIQAECNNYNTRTLISQDLVDQLSADDSFSFAKVAKLMLRGKKERTQLYHIQFN